MVMAAAASLKPTDLAHRSKANVLIRKDDSGDLYRICIRYSSVSANNRYTLQNIDFIKKKVEPLIGSYLVHMKLCTLPIASVTDCMEYLDIKCDIREVFTLKLPDLAPSTYDIIEVDHFTKFHLSPDKQIIIWELKPKWLHQNTLFCRNCTHNSVKERDIDYCYASLMEDTNILRELFKKYSLPTAFTMDMVRYLGSDENVLKLLYTVQEKLNGYGSVASFGSAYEASEDLCLLMTLRDVTCFIRWEASSKIDAKIIDVDLKPHDKWTHWVSEHRKIESFPSKTYH